MPLKCPKCSAALTVTPDELGIIVCGSCGSRFRSPGQVKFTVQGGAGSVPPSAPGPRTEPPTRTPEPPAKSAEQGLPPLSDVDAVLARIDSPPSPDSTIRPGMAGKIAIPRPSPTPVPPPQPASLEAVLSEIRAVRRTQEQILELLRGGAAVNGAQLELGLPRPAPPPAVRGTVLLIDDDPRARSEAAQALQSIAAVRTEADGSGALATIAMERPDVIVLEPGLAGATPGTELLNVIRSTVEWSTIPVVLYARRPGADPPGVGDLLAKGPGSAQALVSRVSTLLPKP
jgi:CheY-like chemotaxis protein